MDLHFDDAYDYFYFTLPYYQVELAIEDEDMDLPDLPIHHGPDDLVTLGGIESMLQNGYEPVGKYELWEQIEDPDRAGPGEDPDETYSNAYVVIMKRRKSTE